MAQAKFKVGITRDNPDYYKLLVMDYVLGTGAGFTEKPLTTMRESLPALREALPDVRLVLAAMGPKMCAFGGAEWDGVFFNWITPEFAAKARGWVEEGARDAGREPPTVFGYVRTAVGAASR